MTYYKLIDAVDQPMSFYVPHTSKSGGKVYERFRMVPGVKYDEYIDDEVFMEAISEVHDKINYTAEKVEALERVHARYTLPKRTCKCQRKKIDVWFVEVV